VREDTDVTEDRSAGREEFITRVLAAAERGHKDGRLVTSDWFLYQGELYKFEVSEPPEGYRLLVWDDHGTFARGYIDTFEMRDVKSMAEVAWTTLEDSRTRRLGRELNPRAACDGGKISCTADAVWAFKANPQDGWMYACGRHLTWSMTEELGGEQGELTVRRIATEE
jgi:hypothetical protein